MDGINRIEEEEVLAQSRGDTKEEELKILNHEERREHEGWRWGSSICGNLRKSAPSADENVFLQKI